MFSCPINYLLNYVFELFENVKWGLWFLVLDIIVEFSNIQPTSHIVKQMETPFTSQPTYVPLVSTTKTLQTLRKHMAQQHS
jgi:hypothetical protein